MAGIKVDDELVAKLVEDTESGDALPLLAFTLEQLDRDGALQESIADLYGDTRAGFLGKALIGGTTLLAAVATPPVVEAGKPKQNDVRIFQWLAG